MNYSTHIVNYPWNCSLELRLHHSAMSNRKKQAYVFPVAPNFVFCTVSIQAKLVIFTKKVSGPILKSSKNQWCTRYVSTKMCKILKVSCVSDGLT